jgi:hypothetical protein
MKRFLSIFKFIFLVFITTFVCVSTGDYLLLLFSLIELVLISIGCSILYEKKRKLAYLLNFILGFIYSSQLFVYYFSGEFISMLMLENVNMISNLGDELIIYVLTCIPILAVLFLPIYRFSYSKRNLLVVSLSAVYIVLLVLYYSALPRSPYTATVGGSVNSIRSRIYQLIASYQSKDRIYERFHKFEVLGTDVKIVEGESPKSVILLLTEGLSAEVLDVYNTLGYNLTPNIDSLYYKSMVFDNYFNHTAATFRGVRGQLYSSHQYDGGVDHGNGFNEVDESVQNEMLNTKLVSIINILKSKKGYNTCYINPEPENKRIVNYIYSLGVDTIMSGDIGDAESISDKQNFEVLKKAIRYYKSKEEPFFIVCYNVGTHHGYDSPDLKYGDAKNSYLNKFYNYDACFGDFFKEMDEEGVFENTLLVFTADHATYPVPEYKETFNSIQTIFINKIPLFLYTKGIKPEIRNAQGRNSLDLAPTLLDILNVNDVENYFLGTTLFSDDESDYSHFCTLGNEFYYISDDDFNLQGLGERNSLVRSIRKYYEISVTKIEKLEK